MNKSLRLYFIFPLLISCLSGQTALDHGDYVRAVRQSVDYLRQNPNHIKSQETLRKAYPLAIDLLETKVAYAIESNAPSKWKQTLLCYNTINQLHDYIKTSPAALSIIPEPITKSEEIAEIKKKAALESYDAGINAMMQDTRQDAIRAYQLFNEANELQPGIKEVFEMQHQAKFNATLRIVYSQKTGFDRWVTVEPIVNSLNKPFTMFYTPMQAEEYMLPTHQTMLIEILDYDEESPSISKTESTHSDSVEVEKFVKGKLVKTKEKVVGKSIVYEKKIVANGYVRITITENKNKRQLLHNTFKGTGNWSGTWSECSGDVRAIPQQIKNECSKSEPNPENQKLLELARKDVLDQIERALSSLYQVN